MRYISGMLPVTLIFSSQASLTYDNKQKNINITNKALFAITLVRFRTLSVKKFINETTINFDFLKLVSYVKHTIPFIESLVVNNS